MQIADRYYMYIAYIAREGRISSVTLTYDRKGNH